jgi:hypothetical protein
MAMYLNDVPVVTTMLLGRWSSDAFLRYIRPQVQQFSRGVASKTIQRPFYRHVPDATRATRRFHKSMSAAATAVMISNRVSPRYAFRVWA